MAVRHKILVILGATASGKSALAMELAERTQARILSADSMQVYRGMDIGTAKPTPAERARVRHHGIDLVSPAELFTVARFVELAEEVIHQAAIDDTPLIVTGGTPLYYKALFEGLFEGPAADDAVRAGLRVLSNADLHARLSVVDPVAAARIHLQDSRRLIRALEVYELTGQPISALQTEWKEMGESGAAARHEATWIGLNWDKELLNRRINARVKLMMDQGWLDETRGLLAAYGQLSQTAAEAAGYRQLIAHLAGEMPLEDAVEQIKISTRQLARRQVKWLRRFRNVTWLAGDQPMEEMVRAAMALWQRSGDAAALLGAEEPRL